MAIRKRLRCTACGTSRWVEREDKTVPSCQKCGGACTYSSKWYVDWYARDERGALRKYSKTVHGNRKVAEEFEARMAVKKADGEVFERKEKFLFKEAAEIFLDDCRRRVREQNMGERTLQFYEGRIRANLLPHFGQIPLEKITPESIDIYKEGRMKVVAPASVNRELATLRRLFSIMILKRKAKANPFQAVELIRERNKRDRFLEQYEIDALLKSCSQTRRNHQQAPAHLLPIVQIALNTGLRLDGILGLRWEHVDWERNEIIRSVKGKKVVRIPMTAECKQVLQNWRESRPISFARWVFPSPKVPTQQMPSGANFGFEMAVKMAGLEDVTFHTLRHTFATHFLMKTGDIHTLSQILGHSTIYMTERYSHLLDERRREAMRIFEGG